ncbi:ParA family protein [Corynebacterium alimapuense]|uniref:CobQ/CobB/MinD/ParA nucleotide binding domain-containing protein n=1 Tax=Corynebacterium alimapuense TaxID=1576874 RepID=A0A3M8K6L8_9CORY|nr:ParA family protein [Corynebacterium alimapuense]RNE48867.1 hypothetical protein C5L39_06115 [Corynebacterium alimapuense]
MILTVANLKGGSGRTTTALMLAQVASEHGASVRVVDADPRGGSATTAKYATKEGSPLPFPVDRVPIYEKHAETYPLTDRILNPSRQYDLTIIDTASVSPAAIRILSPVSDFVIIPAFPSSADFHPTLATVESVAGSCAVLLNRIGRAVTLEAEFLLQLQKKNVNIFDTAIPDIRAFRDPLEGRMKDNLYDYEMVAGELQEMLRSKINVAWGTTYKPKSTAVPN